MVDINSLQNYLKDFSFKQETLELIYILKAWEKLSLENKISDKYSFDNFYNKKVAINRLVEIFDFLAKDIKLFNLYSLDNKMFNNDELISLLTLVKNNSLPNINDIFYNQRQMDFSVSNQVAQLGLKLLDAYNSEIKELYVPFTNGFAYAKFTNKNIYADFPMLKASLIAELINIIEDKNINFSMTNAIESPTFTNEDAPHILKKFDNVLSFPPFRLIGKIDISKDKFHRFKFQKGTVLDIAHFEHILAQTKKRAVVLSSVGFTYRGNFEQEFRKHLIEENFLEAIIQLPANLFIATSIETTLFVLNKEKVDEKVYFLNLKDEYFLKRDGKKIILKDIDEIIDVYTNKKEIDAISSIVAKEQIIAGNYSFAIDRYVIAKEQEHLQKTLEQFELIPLEKIADARRSQLFKDEEEGLKVYEVSPTDFSSAGFTIACGKIKHIGSQEKRLLTYKLEPYDVLLSTKGVIGKVAIVGDTKDVMVASQAIQVIRIRDENKKEKAIILYMFFKSKLAQNKLFSLVGGVSMPQISPSEIKQLGIPLLKEPQEKKLIQNFKDEQEFYDQIEKLNQKINDIHESF